MLTVQSSYNLSDEDIQILLKKDWEFFFKIQKRNSLFGCILYDNISEKYYLIRDHLGNIPIFFSKSDSLIKPSFFVTDVIGKTTKFSSQGILSFLYYWTTKIDPLFEDIGIALPGGVCLFDPCSKTLTQVFRYEVTPNSNILNDEKWIINETEKLLDQAVQRLLPKQGANVGIFLSGGMDSGLVAHLLAKKNICLNAYTAAPRGLQDQEIIYAKESAASLPRLNTHTIVPFSSKEHDIIYSDALKFYPNPCGTTTMIGVTALCRSSNILENEVVFFAQNADTLFSSVVQQYLSYFFDFVPRWLQRVAYRFFGKKTMLLNYVAILTNGMIDVLPAWFSVPNSYNRIQKIALIGMCVGHTPSDGEVMFGPFLKFGVKCANPYYDMDFIEHCMAIPLWYRIGYSKESKIFIALKKTILRKVAIKYLPEYLVMRKKGFVVPESDGEDVSIFLKNLPNSFEGIKAVSLQSRLGAKVLSDYFSAITK